MQEDNISERWAKATDEVVIRAYREDLEEYDDTAKPIITDEYTKRSLQDVTLPSLWDRSKKTVYGFLIVLIMLLAGVFGEAVVQLFFGPNP